MKPTPEAVDQLLAAVRKQLLAADEAEFVWLYGSAPKPVQRGPFVERQPTGAWTLLIRGNGGALAVERLQQAVPLVVDPV